MVRFLGVCTGALALLIPSWGTVRSATGLAERPTHAPASWPLASRAPVPPFLPAHVRTQSRSHLRAPTGPRELVLTFDDGPELTTTPLVLQALDRYGYKAAFFVAGRRLIGKGPGARARRALLAEIVRRGHLVANHTVRHKNLCREPALIDEEIDLNQRILRRVLGQAPKLFRPPFGASCPQLDRALAERQLVSVGWTIDPQDWRVRNPDEVVSYVTRRLTDMDERGVLLLHDTRKPGVRALPTILAWIHRESLKGERGEARPLEVVSPARLLPSRIAEPLGLEPIAEELANNLLLLPSIVTRPR
ncbi:MAG: polysaccharide deacetylase family protein [Myxococcales bacterium]|nr:polysaccharide deacetylase family protein [Myxococcales bacterium]